MLKNLNTKYKKKVLLVDIDNTICNTFGSNYKKSKPNKKIIKFLNKLKNDGYYIKIFTSRYMNRTKQNVKTVNQKYYKVTYKQLISWDLKFDELIMGKPSSDIIIDDRSINPLNKNFYKDIKLLLKK